MPSTKIFRVLYRPDPIHYCKDNNISATILGQYDTPEKAGRAAKAFLLNYLTSLDKTDFFGIDEFIRKGTSIAAGRRNNHPSKTFSLHELSTLDLGRKYDIRQLSLADTKIPKQKHSRKGHVKADKARSREKGKDNTTPPDPHIFFQAFDDMQHFFAHMEDMKACPDSRRMDGINYHYMHDLQEGMILFGVSVPACYMKPPEAHFWINVNTDERPPNKYGVQDNEIMLGEGLRARLTPGQIDYILHRGWSEIVKFYNELPENATPELLASKLRRTTFAMTQIACIKLPSLHRLLVAFGAKVIKLSELQHAKGDVFVMRASLETLTSHNLILKYKPKMILSLFSVVSSMVGLMSKLKMDLAIASAKSSRTTTPKKAHIEIRLQTNNSQPNTPKSRSRRLTSAASSPFLMSPDEKRKEPDDERDDTKILAERANKVAKGIQDIADRASWKKATDDDVKL